VNVPGYGEDRINTAHATGDMRKYPGGGVALAKKTVWYTLGVPVHYYVRINFVGFEKLVDAIGGITINVEKPIHDAEYPDNAYGTFVLDIPAGVQQMNGVRALQYARTRHGSSDFDRMARQRAVIMAAGDKLLSVDTLARIPQLLQIAGDTVKTDLTLDEMIALANIAKQLDRARVRSASVDQSITATVVTPQGAMVEVPDWDKLRKLLDDLFPAAIIPVAATPNLIKTQLAAEEVRIELQNGTLVTDLAKNTAERLREKGLNVVLYGDAERFDYAETLIVPYTDKRYTVEALASQLAVRPENIRRANNGKPGVDVLIILGQDYARQVARQ
jgi:LCP family protein required for cell wall assembly